jgi:DNA/RNA-binding domain of Phe-tRNA-synthetase-like protein
LPNCQGLIYNIYVKFTIDPAIFDAFPDVNVGLVCFQTIENKQEIPEITTALRAAEADLPGHLGASTVVEHPHIHPWREAYRKFGAKPKENPSSIENLIRRILKGSPVSNINSVVDIYNLISLKYLVPVGGEDLDKIIGDVQLTFAGDSEAPVKLLGEPEARPPKPGEVIYKDDEGAICRRWNWKEADRTKFTLQTKNGILVIEGLPPVGREIIQMAITELSSLVQKHCGGTAQTAILNRMNPFLAL